MDSVSFLRAVITPSFQVACPHSVAVAAAMAACVRVQKRKGEITAEDMAELNDAVVHEIPLSLELATAYCKIVNRIVWGTKAREQNRITAGVATVALVLTAMTSHVEDADVQSKGADALAGLAFQNPVNIAGMLALGAPDSLYTAADTHIASRNVQRSMCWALYRISCSSADGKETLIAGRAAEVATRAKNLYPGSYTDLLLSLLSVLN